MSKLYLVPTPIGNLEDITLRAVRILKEADIILAEDTRTTGNLLKHLQIQPKRLFAHHQHNEHTAIEEIAKLIKSGQTIALVSDAGTPGISDPGFLLVRHCLSQNIDVECLPGPTAFVPALVASGLPCDSFVFEGFLPQKKGRQTRVIALSKEERTIVLYESPHRVVKALEQFAEHMGPERKAVVVRELSKMFETFHRGTLAELKQYFEKNQPKGEIVMVIEGLST